MRTLAAKLLVLGVLLSGATCKPEFGERESLVDRTQVLAVRIEPPEAKPGEAVTTTLLVASPSGPVEAPQTSWAFCATPKLLTENGSVSKACLGTGVVPIADARGGVTAPLPASGCFDFGPETQSADVRPRDPDVTGGYFLPIRAQVAVGAAPLTAFGFARLSCNLANASGDIATRFREQYKRNVNPTLLPLEARLEGVAAAVALDAIPRGARVVLRAAWKPEDAEPYVVYDIGAQLLETRRESLRVSWFTTAGSFDKDRTGRTDEELETFAENTWTAPDDAGVVVHLWIVLRDGRGGVAFASLSVRTQTAQPTAPTR
jgi:hypothetical protein